MDKKCIEIEIGRGGGDGWGMKPNKIRFEGKPAEAKKF
jgi:hypothetical protein